MSLCQGAKVKMGAKLSEEFPVKVGVHQGSVLSSPLLFAVVADVVTESAREDLMNEILCPDDLLLMAETVEDSSENFHKWKATFESKGMKVNLGKTKVMLNGSNGEILKSKVDPAFVERKLYRTRCCAQGAESGFMWDVRRLSMWHPAWLGVWFVKVVWKEQKRWWSQLKSYVMGLKMWMGPAIWGWGVNASRTEMSEVSPMCGVKLMDREYEGTDGCVRFTRYGGYIGKSR